MRSESPVIASTIVLPSGSRLRLLRRPDSSPSPCQITASVLDFGTRLAAQTAVLDSIAARLDCLETEMAQIAVALEQLASQLREGNAA